MTEYGLQMYSVRDLTEKDLRGALKRVAELGYKHVEFAGFFGNSAEDVRSWLAEYGLTVSATHTGCAAITPDEIKKTIAYHKELGCTELIVPGARYSTPEELEYTVALFNYAEKKLAAAGITLGYHNHSKEFYPTSYGKVVMDEILARTNVHTEIDTFWLFNAGIDPIPYLEAHKDRIRVIHVKDGIFDPAMKRDFDTAHDAVKGKALGEGVAPVKAVREWALANGVRMVVESEGLDPTGLEEVGRCIRYLATLEN
jgi:sugar phosphate isomerase/epimerase